MNTQSNSKPIEDLGFGTNNQGKSARRLNKNGTFNVKRTGIKGFNRFELYHLLISMSWLRFILLVIGTYFIVNLIFAGLYMLVGVENLTGIEGKNNLENFFESFFFSSQTVTTLGYGRIAPIGILASTIASIESMIGLLGFAIATGLLYGRFSKPGARILYSNNALIAPYKNINGLMFRFVNERKNQLIEAEVEVVFSKLNEDKKTRAIQTLSLERSKINFLALNWTVVHPIDKESPLFGLTKKDLEEVEAEFYVLLKAFDDTFSQTIYSRTSYIPEDIIWGAKFKNMMSFSDEKYTTLHLKLINEFDKVELNTIE